MNPPSNGNRVLVGSLRHCRRPWAHNTRKMQNAKHIDRSGWLCRAHVLVWRTESRVIVWAILVWRRRRWNTVVRRPQLAYWLRKFNTFAHRSPLPFELVFFSFRREARGFIGICTQIRVNAFLSACLSVSVIVELTMSENILIVETLVRSAIR